MKRMTRIYNADSECCFSGRKILFDTNVWISIYGNDPRQDDRRAYSEYFSSVLKSDNIIVTNSYILGEYFNRVCKIEYEIEYQDRDPRKFKFRRKSDRFRERIEGVRDTCLNILDDCEFVDLNTTKGSACDWVNQACDGILDFTDIAILRLCVEHDFVVVTHDSDFAACDVDLVTANRRLLG